VKGVFQSIVAAVEVWYVIELYLLKHKCSMFQG